MAREIVGPRPFLSIILPVYNRAPFVARAIRSCLEQDAADFELMIVDDASTDNSVEAIEQFADVRIRLLRHERNRGRCPARNTAMAAARGEWFVFLDSDDELLPGALAAIRRRAAAAPPSVVGLRFMCIDEEGLSPAPPHDDRDWTYEEYLRWLDASLDGRQEALPCARSSTLASVRYAEGHAPEASYHLALARAGRITACIDVVRRYHHDAPNRITEPMLGRDVVYAPDVADNTRQILAVHGDALLKWAPRSYWLLVAGAAAASFLAGRRRDGLRYSVQALRMKPFAVRVCAVGVLGMLGSYPLALAQWMRSKAAAGVVARRRALLKSSAAG